MAEDGSVDEAAFAPAPTQAAAPEQAEATPVPAEEIAPNPFVDTAEDSFSTFAVDVDTASYTQARNYLMNSGQLPPPSLIRPEEFINFFDQDYPLPQDNAFNILMDAAPTPFSDTTVMRVGIQGFDVPDEERTDSTLIFVVDVSGSMDNPNRLGAVQLALTTLVQNLRPTDRVGLVVYGSTGRVITEPRNADDPLLIEVIYNLQSEGSTNAEEGLRLAYEMATANFDPSRINRIILCSDGVANVGATGPEAILESVRLQAREGITLTTVGFGMGSFNDFLMEQLANDGDGQYFYVDSQAEAERVFVEDLTGSLLTIARDAKVQVEFNPAVVEAYRLVGYENRDIADEDFRNDEVDAGEIGAGHSVTALYEVVLSEQAQGDAIAATTFLRWEDPETGEVTEIQRSLTVNEFAASFEEAAPRFRMTVAVAAFADLLSGRAWAQTADPELLLTITDEVYGSTQDSDVAELRSMIERYIQLR
ncbi:MAG: DUF3520 domain-containing protein, partial [Chloroflexi bacterium]|nr:DUF3520 domain-containing protein [Chloroflexota bacterium]